MGQINTYPQRCSCQGPSVSAVWDESTTAYTTACVQSVIARAYVSLPRAPAPPTSAQDIGLALKVYGFGGGHSCHDSELPVLSNQRPLDCHFLMLRRYCSLLIFHRKTSRRFSPIGSDQKRVRYDLSLPLTDHPANGYLTCAGHRRGLFQHVMPNAPDRASTDPLVWIDCEVGHC